MRHFTTDFVVAVGYVAEDHEKDQYNPGDFDPVYSEDDNHEIGVELDNFLPGVFFKTYEEGCKVLTKLLAVRCSHDINIRETFNRLVEEYPEYAI